MKLKKIFRSILLLSVGILMVQCKKDEPELEPAVISFVSETLDFESVEVGKFNDEKLVMSNLGGQDLEIKAIDIVNKDLSKNTTPEFLVKGNIKITIKPKEKAEVIITFKPVSEGMKAGMLNLKTNIGEFKIDLKGKATPAPKAIFNITPKSHDFGDVILGKDAEKELKVKNIGNADLILKTVTMKNSSGQEQNFTVNNLANVKVKPNKTAGIIINFKPKSKGSKSGVLKITTNVGSFEVAVKGKAKPAPKAVFNITPKSHDFGDVEVGSFASNYLKVTNTGTADLILEDFTIEGSSQFGYDPIGSTTIKPNKEGSIYVDFHPKTKGEDTCVLKIKTNVGEFTVNLKGNGVLPEVIFNIDPEGYDFKDVAVGTNVVKELKITNTGDTNLVIETVKMEDPSGEGYNFSIKYYANITIKPNQSKEFLIDFHPASKGLKTAKLKLKTNLREFTIDFKGNGFIGPIFNINPNNYDFGVQDFNSTSEKEFTISNTGERELIISSMKIEGEDKNSFSIDEQISFPLTIKPNKDYKFNVYFYAKGDYSLEANLKIVTNVGEFTVNLEGGIVIN